VNYDDLQSFVRSTFKKLPKGYSLSYVDAEGDSIAITSQSDIDILYLNHPKTASLKLTIIEADGDLLRTESSADEFDNLEEKPIEFEKKPKEKMPEPMDIASLVQSKLNEIIPELTKKVAEEVTNTIRKS
jgi:hypothetical protein